MAKPYKKVISILLVITMCFSMCFSLFQISFDGIKISQTGEVKEEKLSGEDRDLLEKIANLVGVDDDEFLKLSDSQLKDYIEQKVRTSGAIQNKNDNGVKKLSSNTLESEIKDMPSINLDEHISAYNEQGEMKIPFDQIYPELMESDLVEYDEKTVLVKLSNKFDGKITNEMKKAGVLAVEELFSLKKSSWYEASLKKGADITQVITDLRDIKWIEIADYNYQIKTTAMDSFEEIDANLLSNKLVSHQWHLNYCGFKKGTQLLDNPGGNSDVIVAVIDTGIDYNHEDLAENIWINEDEIADNGIDDDNNGYIDDYFGVNIVSGKGNGNDDNGHGTHVAGIIASQNNHLGTVGIAYNTKLMPVKAAMASGYLHSSDIAKAINYAYENDADVINMSFGGNATSIAVQDALSIAYSKCALIASAGNDSHINEGDFSPVVPNYPAALNYVVGVMSVGENGQESDFTNLDYKLYSGSEYEVYAPGEDILSTIPGNKYASWSGTSMAAPMVSAVAALLRSQYSDKNLYSSEFIYGQLTATSENSPICLGHDEYKLLSYEHNVPNIINLQAAISKLPKPDIGLSEYFVFDTEGFEDDVLNKNNGDGVIDAGETVALGLTLRNRWGISKNTVVNIDTLSVAGIADPYIQVVNPTVDYGSIGTYTTGDCGRVFEDGLFVGWKEPFYVRIAKDCPNDYVFSLNVNITCENGLDENDNNQYTFSGKVELNVRNGYVLPSVIEEDMTLTSDNLYIIPNETTIREGATVKVEPGTHIQFWSNDANDPYSSKYIAYLRVEGNFIVEGATEEPVYIYPSDLMSNYAVNIGEYLNGNVILKNAEITNFVYTPASIRFNNSASYAEHCIFKEASGQSLRHRYLLDGNVVDDVVSSATLGKFALIKNSVFYKIDGVTLQGVFDTCAFVDCGMTFSGNKYTNCLFYGNNLPSSDFTRFAKSTYRVTGAEVPSVDPSQVELAYREETGTTYVAISGIDIDDVKKYSELLDWGTAIFETEEEFKWVQSTALGKEGKTYDVGILAHEDGTFRWLDGTLVGDYITQYPDRSWYNMLNFYYGSLDSLSGNTRYLFEIPGEIYLSDICFDNYEVDVDIEATYLIEPLLTPTTFDVKDLVFESSDENIATVDANGLVTPVSKGKVDIYVSSKDKVVRNYVTINIVDYVPLGKVFFEDFPKKMTIGETYRLTYSLEPLNTTRQNVSFTSTNPEIISVDEEGVITAKGRGNANIIVSCEGITDEITVTSYKKIEYLDFKEIGKVFYLSQDTVEIPEVEYGDGDVELSYKSSDDSVISVQNGKLSIKSSGVVVLSVTDEISGLCSEITLYVTSDEVIPKIKRLEGSYYGGSFSLFEDGRVYDFFNKKVIIDNIVDMSIGMEYSGKYGCYALLKNNGEIMYGSSMLPTSTIDTLSDVVRVFAGAYAYFALDKNGTCYAWGSNNDNCTGTGITGSIKEPSLVKLENIVDVYSSYNKDYFAYFLTGDGKLYFAGGKEGYKVPILVAENVNCIEKFGKIYTFANINNKWYRLSDTLGNYIDSGVSFVQDTDKKDPGFTIVGGRVFDYNFDVSAFIPKISDAFAVIGVGSTDFGATSLRTFYVISENDVLYAYGSNYKGQINSDSGIDNYNYRDAVIVPTFNYNKETLAVEASNIVDGVLKDKVLSIDFNGKLNQYGGELYADDKQIPYKHTVSLDTMNISLSEGFKQGVKYQFIVRPENVKCDYLLDFAETYSVEFTCDSDAAKENPADKIMDEPVQERVSSVIHDAVIEEDNDRYYYTEKMISNEANYIFENYNPIFYNNVILNRISTDTDVSRWFRAIPNEVEKFREIVLGKNYWGTTDEKGVALQIVDYTDYQRYPIINYQSYLTTPPEDTFPYVTDVKILNSDGEEITTVGNEEITVRICFNRDMEESIPLQVFFGSAYPYSDYMIEGRYIDPRTWEGKITLSTLIESGTQYLTISNGKAKGTALQFYTDSYRFCFDVDMNSAQALIMQGSATDQGVELTWRQDDFDTLMGYNVYRSTSKDGYYQKLNEVVIPADTKSYFDDTVEPGVVYYYNFTVVKTDLTESTPSGKISVLSKDTMAPNIYHTPVYTANEGSNIIISATVTDNLFINSATVFYRTVGEQEWKMAVMNNLNDKYSAIINSKTIGKEGVEYYIDAFDGVSHTYKGTAENPYKISIQEKVDANSLGDVNGDGKITNLDALMILQAINDILNLNAEQFARADINGDGVLIAAEALKVLQYANGTVGSLKM